MDEIWLGIARDSPSAADRLIDRIGDRVQTLADHPRIGPVRPDIAPDARVLVIGDHLVLDRLADADVEIVRIVRGDRRMGEVFGVVV